jgi:hypothetical protein
MTWVPAVATSVAFSTAVGRRAADHQMEVERLTMQLAVLVPADRHQTVEVEVARRRDLFTASWRESPRLGQAPDVAALRSVADDITAGRWLL